MLIFKRKRTRNYHHPRERYVTYAVAGGCLLVVGILVFLLVGRMNSERTMRIAREEMAAAIQSNVNSAIRIYDSVDKQSSEIPNLLPIMKQHLYTAETVNRVMVSAFGTQYSVYGSIEYAAFDDAASEIDRLVSAGQSTERASEGLYAYMTDMEKMLMARFGSDGVLLPRTAAQTPPQATK